MGGPFIWSHERCRTGDWEMGGVDGKFCVNDIRFTGVHLDADGPVVFFLCDGW